MRILAILALLASPAVAAEAEIEALVEETRIFLDSRIGVAFPDVQLRMPGEKKTVPLSHLKSGDGLLVLYSNAQCGYSIRAAKSLSEDDWKWHGLPVVVVHPKWRKNRFHRSWVAELPDDTPLLQLKKSDPPGWLDGIRAAPILFLLDAELVVRDWSVTVPGTVTTEQPGMVSRFGSSLVVQPSN